MGQFLQPRSPHALTRTVDTANERQHLSRKNWPEQERGRPCKMFLSSSLIIMENLTAVSQTTCAHAGPKNCRDVVINGCAEFGCSNSNCMGLSIGLIVKFTIHMFATS